jgi:hypothetical protein
MGKVKRLELWWQLYLYVTSGSGLRKKPAITLCAFECTCQNEKYGDSGKVLECAEVSSFFRSEKHGLHLTISNAPFALPLFKAVSPQHCAI